MILQALHGYYERMSENPESGMPPYGTSMEYISFALVLDGQGRLQGIEDLRVPEGKKLRPRRIPVPAAVTRSSGVSANCIWDKTAYVLGNDAKGASANAARFTAFRDLLHTVCGTLEDAGYNAVQRFLGDWKPELAEMVVSSLGRSWDELAAANLVFRLEGTKGFIHDRPPIKTAWLAHYSNTDDAPKVHCLISGEQHVPQARVHCPIKGAGGQTSGGYLVSYNDSAYISYGKEKAHVGKGAAFAYTTALNAMLTHGSRQKVIIGDSTLVFWAERTSPAEDFLADLFNMPLPAAKQKPTADHQTTSMLHDLLQAIRSGRRAVDIVPDLDEAVRFYVLGLAPNAARLSIRFWEVNTVGSLLHKIGNHFRDLEIVRQYDNEPEFPPLWLLLLHTATLRKGENISPVLAGGMARAMLGGSLYPHSLLPLVLGRIRAEQTVTYYHAALLKAFLMRNKKLEVSVAFNPTRTDRPYLLGRLFAVLEKAQEEAVPGANATIKDHYLGSASATPGQVFHMLIKNSANHIGKLRKDPAKKGISFHYEAMLQDIISELDDFPKTLNAEEQGLFMIGYYHQRKDFFTPKNKEN